ncbi:hypothetical protein EDD73_103122 [Heliophilum fasciatum]|uniref:Uncharacterized protein n=1 Tax=Heliophilum fasciatum TaxID=35700 RepID=A0A4R2S7V9_9FIRM|nr:hypothetical protein EDD73_103122 [Heliophilum fasciatum]
MPGKRGAKHFDKANIVNYTSIAQLTFPCRCFGQLASIFATLDNKSTGDIGLRINPFTPNAMVSITSDFSAVPETTMIGIFDVLEFPFNLLMVDFPSNMGM